VSQNRDSGTFSKEAKSGQNGDSGQVSDQPATQGKVAQNCESGPVSEERRLPEKVRQILECAAVSKEANTDVAQASPAAARTRETTRTSPS
jgi:hypothetical protein